jgi:hypothetical protein
MQPERGLERSFHDDVGRYDYSRTKALLNTELAKPEPDLEVLIAETERLTDLIRAAREPRKPIAVGLSKAQEAAEIATILFQILGLFDKLIQHYGAAVMWTVPAVSRVALALFTLVEDKDSERLQAIINLNQISLIFNVLDTYIDSPEIVWTTLYTLAILAREPAAYPLIIDNNGIQKIFNVGGRYLDFFHPDSSPPLGMDDMAMVTIVNLAAISDDTLPAIVAENGVARIFDSWQRRQYPEDGRYPVLGLQLFTRLAREYHQAVVGERAAHLHTLIAKINLYRPDQDTFLELMALLQVLACHPQYREIIAGDEAVNIKRLAAITLFDHPVHLLRVIGLLGTLAENSQYGEAIAGAEAGYIKKLLNIIPFDDAIDPILRDLILFELLKLLGNLALNVAYRPVIAGAAGVNIAKFKALESHPTPKISSAAHRLIARLETPPQELAPVAPEVVPGAEASAFQPVPHVVVEEVDFKPKLDPEYGWCFPYINKSDFCIYYPVSEAGRVVWKKMENVCVDEIPSREAYHSLHQGEKLLLKPLIDPQGGGVFYPRINKIVLALEIPIIEDNPRRFLIKWDAIRIIIGAADKTRGAEVKPAGVFLSHRTAALERMVVAPGATSGLNVHAPEFTLPASRSASTAAIDERFEKLILDLTTATDNISASCSAHQTEALVGPAFSLLDGYGSNEKAVREATLALSKLWQVGKKITAIRDGVGRVHCLLRVLTQYSRDKDIMRYLAWSIAGLVQDVSKGSKASVVREAIAKIEVKTKEAIHTALEKALIDVGSIQKKELREETQAVIKILKELVSSPGAAAVATGSASGTAAAVFASGRTDRVGSKAAPDSRGLH